MLARGNGRLGAVSATSMTWLKPSATHPSHSYPAPHKNCFSRTTTRGGEHARDSSTIVELITSAVLKTEERSLRSRRPGRRSSGGRSEAPRRRASVSPRQTSRRYDILATGLDARPSGRAVAIVTPASRPHIAAPSNSAVRPPREDRPLRIDVYCRRSPMPVPSSEGG